MSSLILSVAWFLVSSICLVYYAGNGDALKNNSVTPRLILILFVFPVYFIGVAYLGFRPFTAGTDTPAYVYAYQNIGSLFEAHSNGVFYYGNTEFLWWPFHSFLSIFFDERQWLVVVYTISFVMIYLAFKELCSDYDVIPYVFCFSLMTYYFVYLGNGIRQTLALPFALLALRTFFDKKYLRSISFGLLAVGFHWSTLVLFALPIFNIRFFNSRAMYKVLPVLALCMSGLFDYVMEVAVDTLGMQTISDKHDLYFSDERVSHIEYVWKTANFWICVFTSYLFLWFVKPEPGKLNFLHKYLCFLICLILVSVNNVDFSERYMPAVLLMLPLSMNVLMSSFSLSQTVKNITYLLFFVLMFAGVLLNESAQITLGYVIEEVR